MTDDITDPEGPDPAGPAVRQHLLTLAAGARTLPIDPDALVGRVKRRRAVRRAVAGGVALGVVVAGSITAVQLSEHSGPEQRAATELSTGPTATPSHGSLTDREFAVAVAVARAEADRDAKEEATVTSATATIGERTETDSNMGSACTSGRVLHIKLMGTFPHIATTSLGDRPTPRPPQPVSAVVITADPESGKACLIGVQTGPTTPEPGAALLFTN